METKIYKTSVTGIGQFCVEFPDGEIITTRNEARQHLLSAADDLLHALKRICPVRDNHPSTCGCCGCEAYDAISKAHGKES